MNVTSYAGDGPPQLVTISGCAFFAATASTCCGFGGAVLFLAFAAVAAPFVEMPLTRVIMLSMVRSCVTNPVTIYLGGRANCDGGMISVFVAGAIVGAPIGQVCLYVLPAQALQTLLSSVCLVVVLERLVKLREEKRARAAAGAKAAIAVEVADVAEPTADDEAAGAAPEAPASDSAPMMLHVNRAASDAPAAADDGAPRVDASAQRAAPLRLWPCSCQCACAVACALASGVLGASISTGGIPLLLYTAYFPLPKGKVWTDLPTGPETAAACTMLSMPCTHPPSHGRRLAFSSLLKPSRLMPSHAFSWPAARAWRSCARSSAPSACRRSTSP